MSRRVSRRPRIVSGIVIDLTSSSSEEERPVPPTPPNSLANIRIEVLTEPLPEAEAESSRNSDPNTSNSSHDSDVEYLGEVPIETPAQPFLELFALTKPFYQKYLTDQNYISLKVLWEMSVYELRNRPHFNRPAPIAVETVREPNTPETMISASLTPEADMQRIICTTYVIKMAFDNKRKNKLRILRQYLRTSKAYNHSSITNMYLFVDGKFTQVSPIEFDINEIYMRKPTPESLCWPISFVGLMPELGPDVNNFYQDNSEEVLKIILDQLDANLRERSLP